MTNPAIAQRLVPKDLEAFVALRCGLVQQVLELGWIDSVLAFGFDVGDNTTVALETRDALFERRFMKIAVGTAEGFRPEGEALEAFLRDRFHALASDKAESIVEWTQAWHEAIDAQAAAQTHKPSSLNRRARVAPRNQRGTG